ncbi:hypothetical protein PMIN03_002376 [Paraphaeosphaeria minitans]
MAPARGAAGADKRGRKKKSKSRTKVEVSSSSESDSDTHQQNIKQSKKTNKVVGLSVNPTLCDVGSLC